MRSTRDRSEMSLKSETPEFWDILRPGYVDRSTARKNVIPIQSQDFNQGTWGNKPTMNWFIQAQGACAFYCDAYFGARVGLSSTSNDEITPYADGAAIALAPDFASNFVFTRSFKLGSEIVEETETQVEVSSRIRTLVSYSKDYSQFMKGYNDLVFLDEPGFAQDFDLPAAPTNLITATAGTGNGDVFDASAFANLPGGAGTTVVENVISAVVPPVTSSAAMTVGFTTTNGGTLGTVTTGGTLTGATTPTHILSYNTTNAAGTLLLNATRIAADVLYLNGLTFASNTGFQFRQTLTNNGKMVDMKIPLRRILDFCEGYREFIFGQMATLQLTVTPTAINNCIERNAAVTTAGNIYMSDIKLYVPTRQPSVELANTLRNRLVSGARAEFVWDRFTTQLAGSWPLDVPATGATIDVPATFNQSFGAPADPADYIIVTCQLTSDQGNQLRNNYYSCFPGPSIIQATRGLYIQQAYIQYLQTTFPQDGSYGQYFSDQAGRQWDAILEVTGRKEEQLMAPIFDYDQSLKNYNMLVFPTKGMYNTMNGGANTVQLFIKTYNSAYQYVTPTGAIQKVTLSVFATFLTVRRSAFKGVDGIMVYEYIPGGPISTPNFLA